MDYHSLKLGDLVGSLKLGDFGLDLDRNTLPLKDGNDGKGQDKKKRNVCNLRGTGHRTEC